MELKEEERGEDGGISMHVPSSLIMEPLEGVVRTFAYSARRNEMMTVLYKAVRVVATPLQGCKRKRFVLTIRKMSEWKCIPLQVAYDCIALRISIC